MEICTESVTVLINHRLIRMDEIVSNMAVIIECGKISAIVPVESIPASVTTVDLGGYYLSPGLIDLQVYGSGRKLFGGNPSEEALQQMENDFVKQGTTAFLATVATNEENVFHRAIEAFENFLSSNKSVGSCLGLHFEGPFISPHRRGAHPARHVQTPSVAAAERVTKGRGDVIKMMTVAPELIDAATASYLTGLGVTLSCGHTNATYEEGVIALQMSGSAPCAFKAATHLFNVMPPLHHREPGIVAAIFECGPFASVVADGIHVSFAMIKLAKRILRSRLFLITDAVTESNEGTYPHIFKGDRYVMPDGTLSGSALTMMTAVKNCVQHCDISLTEAIAMASRYPAEVLGAHISKGKIEKGFDADLVVFDKEFVVQKTFVKGVCLFSLNDDDDNQEDATLIK
jgi:N-acetylglucosamine-6-phosphate deacetylase